MTDASCRDDPSFSEAVRLYREGDIDTALMFFRKSAENGNPVAQFTVGTILRSRGDRTALRWLSMSAENGYAEAQYTLGNLYYTGEIAKQSMEQARSSYRDAAEQALANSALSI